MNAAASVLVLGDTHLARGVDLPDAVLLLADRADHVIHTGDFVTLDVLETLRALAPVSAVHGNVCDGDVVAMLPERLEVEIAGLRVGLVHDAGPSLRRHGRLAAAFPTCGVVAYGHSHLPELAWHDDLLVLNPGSCTQRRRAPDHTVAWLEIEGGRVRDAHLVHLDSA